MQKYNFGTGSKQIKIQGNKNPEKYSFPGSCILKLMILRKSPFLKNGTGLR